MFLSRKRPVKSNAALAQSSPSKVHKPQQQQQQRRQQNDVASPPSSSSSTIDTMVSVLAEAGCTLINPTGPPCIPSDLHKLRFHLHRRFSDDSSLRSDFLNGFSSYVNSSPANLRRVLLPSNCESSGLVRSESLVRIFLLVPPIQLEIQNIMVEKLPEYFDVDPGGACGPSYSSSLNDDVARLILNQFRWLDFLVDSEAFIEKLFQVLSICPLHLKKEIIGSLPEIVGDQCNKTVVDSLRQMLEEDSSVIVPVLDCFSNLNLEDLLQEQVITIALSRIRTVDEEHMPYLLRFLLLSANTSNAWRIISQIREQLKFVGTSNVRITQQSKLKGKSVVNNTEASVLLALRSSLQFKNILSQEILKELKALEKPRDHKVIDIWLLTLIYMNGESLQKNVERLLKKKIVEGCIEGVMFEECILGNRDLAQDYLPTFLSMSEYLLTCKEQKARDFGIHMCVCLFEEFADSYSRQEVLGALVEHVGSGISHEVNSALEAIVLLASRHSQELIPLGSYLTGILDYLEGFAAESLHKVYEIFSILALSARSSTEHFKSAIANELLMIVRKQLINPDLIYKRMGLIGTMKVLCYFGDPKNRSHAGLSQKLNFEEALELLKTSLDSCKQSPLPLILFYEELVAILEKKTLHPAILEWIGNHVGEFESKFLSDLDGAQLPDKASYCGLEGELWMNLDGDISPICLNILPLASSSLRSASSLQILPANFVLLAAIERLVNQGSLGGIDALLGCPMHLPSPKLFSQSTWHSLSGKQKQIVILCLYYAANWIRELLNTFSTQITERCECISQTTKEEIVLKLVKRWRNLVFLECLLNNALREYPLSLPELYPQSEHLLPNQLNQTGNFEKKTEDSKVNDSLSQNKKRKRKTSKTSANSDTDGKLRQQTIIDVLKKAGSLPSQEVPNENPSSLSSTGNQFNKCNASINIEICAAAMMLEEQRNKFRPLSFDCFSILANLKIALLKLGLAITFRQDDTEHVLPLHSLVICSLLNDDLFNPNSAECFPPRQNFSVNQDTCCPDPAAELPLHLYILRDLHKKMDNLSPLSKQCLARHPSASSSFSGTKVTELLDKINPLFPSLRKYLDCALCILREETCDDHWNVQSGLAGNPDIADLILSKSSISSSVIKETLWCFGKVLNLPDIHNEKSVVTDLLKAFQPTDIPECFFNGMQLIPSPGSIDYLYCGVYSYLEGIFDVACTLSFTLASQVVLTLESVVTSIHEILNRRLDVTGKDIHREPNRLLLPFLRSRLGASAQDLLKNKCYTPHTEDNLKIKGDVMQKILRIYLDNCESTSDLLNELVRSTLTQVPSSRTQKEDTYGGFATLCPATFAVWYRVMHEENLVIVNNLVKSVVALEKPRTGAKADNVEELLNKLEQSVNVVVSLVNMCRTHDKLSVHAMAVKYGGKFVDSFLKVFDFLQAQFPVHNETILRLVRELQKATRTIQTLCSEAKGLKQTAIISKVPATKRSMERFLFHVKALLHTTPSGCTFWMGNLKHKDLTGHIVSSQAYIDDQAEDVDDNAGDNIAEDQEVDANEE